MGLLDFDFDMNDPKTMGLLNLGLGILAGNTGRPGDMGAGLAQGLGNYQQMIQAQQRQKMLEQQQQMQNEQYGWQKQDRERADKQAEARNAAFGNIASQYGIDPSIMSAFPDIGSDLVKNKLMPKAPKIAFAPNGLAYDENNPQLQPGRVYGKEPEQPSAVKEYQFAQGQGYKGSFNDFVMAQKKAGASNVSVGFPKETFKNERDLRNDFQGLPTTKAFREIQNAYDQISTALARPSAANDLAAATKFMKILDPGSVVRESELAMAMEATGKLDQLQNYANRIKTGEKLTEKQRADFGAAAEALYDAAAERYNQSAEEYRGMAGDYQLDPERIAKPAPKKLKPKSGFSITAPDGNTYTFPDQKSLNNFKMKAGLK
jgi:hypothetical protein